MPLGAKAAVSYKRQDGTLAVAKDGRYLSWTPLTPPKAPPQLTLSIGDVANLQQTPAGSAKVSIKVVIQRAGAPNAENYVFSFASSSDAMAEQTVITSALRSAIEAHKARQGPQVVTTDANGTGGGSEGGNGDGGPRSAAMAIAQAVSAKEDENGSMAGDSQWADEAKLRSNITLQRSLLSSNVRLRKIFEQALIHKPASISASQFSAKFWSSRLHLLRSHSAEKQQRAGAYNVFSEIKPKNVDGTTRLNLNKEHIGLIFEQHPLVKIVYNDNVPPMTEMDFWARFFVSRLFKKLKGEKITDIDSTDPLLDKYSDRQEDDLSRQTLIQDAQIPNFLNLSGNEQNHSQQQGNANDFTMRPNAPDKVPILRILNSMSEKIMARVAPVDASAQTASDEAGDRHGPVGMDEETFNAVRLRDLQTEASDNRIRLNIRNQDALLGASAHDQSSMNVRSADQQPEAVLRRLRNTLISNKGAAEEFERSADTGDWQYQGFDIEATLGVLESSDSEDDDMQVDSTSGTRDRPLRVGSQAALKASTADILSAIGQQRSTADEGFGDGPSQQVAAELGLSSAVFETLSITHSTTIEFLHYFWPVFLERKPSSTSELKKLLETLDRSLDRIRAVAETAEAERTKQIEGAKKQLMEYQRRTGKRTRPFDPNSIGGGAKVVEQLMEPTIKAIGFASNEYKSSLTK